MSDAPSDAVADAPGSPLRPGSKVLPLAYQPPLPADRAILHEPPDEEAVPMDVLFVGGGPAGLAGAIELARLVRADNEAGGGLGDIEIGVLEKAAALGEHSLSGAVVNPGPFRELFPDIAVEEMPFRRPVTKEAVYLLRERGATKLPTPPSMRNHGNWIASLSEVVRWMGEQAEGMGVNVFPGFPVASLLAEEKRIVGVRTTPAGLGRDGSPGAGHEPAMDLTARVTVLSEGTRGLLTQAWHAWQGTTSANPQIYALGVKELWETKRPLDRIIHTLGWPLPRSAFGGSWAYPMEDNLVSLGLVVGLDYPDARLDVHELLQRMKLHPLFREILEGGEMVEWGAKTIPEGGFHALADRRHGDGCIVIGDAAGYVDVPSLKGIHYAVQSGLLAARAIFRALKADDTSEAGLRAYTESVDASFIASDLRKTRNMRLAFKSGFVGGGVRAGLMTLTGGRFPGGRIAVEEDAAEPRVIGPSPSQPFVPDGKLTFSKVDAVFKSGNATRDDIPSHLLVGEDVSAEMAEFLACMCPAGVYERDGDRLVVNAPNCVDCKATDVVGPRWTPREGGSGPSYRRM
jgi:electron-transferring-flavoprotein dehydrogenase